MELGYDFASLSGNGADGTEWSAGIEEVGLDLASSPLLGRIVGTEQLRMISLLSFRSGVRPVSHFNFSGLTHNCLFS
jgi:hypothetical protein